MTTATEEVTLDQVIMLVNRLPLADQARLVERVLPRITQAVATTAETIEPQHPRSLRGILADLGPAPSAQEIDEVRREMWANFPSEDI